MRLQKNDKGTAACASFIKKFLQANRRRKRPQAKTVKNTRLRVTEIKLPGNGGIKISLFIPPAKNIFGKTIGRTQKL